MADNNDNKQGRFQGITSLQPHLQDDIHIDMLFSRIELPCLNINEKRMRFLSLLADKRIEITESISEMTGVPLFMGCDVLAGCPHASSNHARIHARYSKLGLATKLVLKDFRIEGVKKGSLLWFYSIEGVFRVIFEYQYKSVQRAILASLMDVWISRFDDCSLHEVYEVTIHKESLMSKWSKQRTTRTHQINIAKERHIEKETTHIATNNLKDSNDLFSCHSHTVKTADKLKESLQLESHNSEKVLKCSETIPGNSIQRRQVKAKNMSEPITQICFSEVDARTEELAIQSEEPIATSLICTREIKQRNVDSKVDASSQTDDLSAGKTVIFKLVESASFKNVKSLGLNESELRGANDRNRQNIVRNIQEYSRNSVPQLEEVYTSENNPELCSKCSSFICRNLNDKEYLDKLITDVTYFVEKYSKRWENNSSNYLETFLKLLKFQNRGNVDLLSGFPFELIDLFLKDIQNNELSETEIKASSRDIFLCTVSKWLGKQYFMFQNYISDKVEKFKKDYIVCIDDLPQSETIVSLIFPKCMQELLKSWIGCDDKEIEDLPNNLEDHNYVPTIKRTKFANDHEDIKSDIPYPLIQLILEFANKALVSGVAHVVYSKVCHAV